MSLAESKCSTDRFCSSAAFSLPTGEGVPTVTDVVTEGFSFEDGCA